MTEKTVEWYQKELSDRFAYFYYQTDGTFNFPNSAEGDLLKMTQKMLNLMKADHQPTFEVGEYYRVCGTTKLTYKVTPNDISEKQETKFYVDHEDRFVKMNLRKEAIERDEPATAEQIAEFKRAEHFAKHGRKLDEFHVGDKVENEECQIGIVQEPNEKGQVCVQLVGESVVTGYYSAMLDMITLIQTAEELREVGE